MAGRATYLGVPLIRPRVGFFEFTSCEGCQLQVLNDEGSLLDFLSLVDVVNFREAMTERSDEYDIAFVEGSITRSDEAERLRRIRENASTVVAMGSCACFGGVNRLKNLFADHAEVIRSVYGEHTIESVPAMAVDEVIKIDARVLGCPIKKKELENLVLSLCLGKRAETPDYPVCMECKASGNICLFELGRPCLGPVTRAGCGAWCPGARASCWGCRGPAKDANMKQLHKTMKERGFPDDTVTEMLECFGGFAKEGAAS